jgi:hypothetical protein
MATAKEQRVTQATEYVVLEQRELKDDAGETVVAWVESGTVSGTTRSGVVGEVAGDREGIWRPVPTRNWADAMRTRNETTTKTKVEPVEPF